MVGLRFGLISACDQASIVETIIILESVYTGTRNAVRGDHDEGNDTVSNGSC